MDTLDAELRRVLTSADVSADPEVALAGVHALNRRRTAWRVATRAVVAAAAVGVVTAAALLGSSPDAAPPVVENPDQVDLTGTIPWSDRTDYEEWPPAVHEDPGPSGEPCRAENLELAHIRMEGAGGHSATQITYTNIGQDRCSLLGFPRLVGSDGEVDALHGTFFPQPALPANLAPGQEGRVVVETSLSCDPQTPTILVPDLRLMLEDGSMLATGRDLESSCPLRVGRWFRPTQPVESPIRFGETLSVVLDVPESVRPGGVLTYVVTLTNTGSEPIDLTPCPGFRQSLSPLNATGEPAKPVTSGAYRLSCERVPSIGPGDSARFEMRADVPLELEGEARLLWVIFDTLYAEPAEADVAIAP